MRPLLSRSCRVIRDTFFNHRGHLAVQLTIEPLALSTTRLSSMLSVDGQLIPYQHGAPQRTGLVWPNSLSNTNGSQLTPAKWLIERFVQQTCHS
jgi:type VI secretion system protein ImpL